jgi:hypothetical protein
MSAAITAAVVGIAAAGYGAYQSTKASNAAVDRSKVPAGQQATGVGTSQQEFPEATRRLIQSTEFPLLANFLGAQASRFSTLGGNVATNPFVQQQYGQAAPALALAAGKEGAQQAGIGDFGPVNEQVAGLAPELTNALRQLTLAQGAKQQGVIQQGYGNFLAPGNFSTSEKVNAPNPFQTGSTLAQGLTGIASQVQTLTSDNPGTAPTTTG